MIQHTLLLVSAGLFLSTPLPAQKEPRALPLAIQGVTIISMSVEEPLPDRTVLVQGDRIVAVGPTSDIEVPHGSTVVDGTGKFLMPGLCDMHVHLTDGRDGLLYLANGVTTIRNLSGQPYHLDLAEIYRRGDLPGPTLVSSGPQVRFGEGVSDDDVFTLVAEQQELGFASVKLYGRTSLANLRALGAASHELGMPIVGHVPRNLTLEEVVEVGAHREISHAEEMLYSFFDRHDLDEPGAVEECARLLRSSGAYVTPTISVYNEIATQVTDLAGVLARPDMRFLPPLGHFVFGPLNKYGKFDEGDLATLATGRAVIARLTLALQEAGVPLMVGTDAMNPSVLPGFSIHDELAELVNAGLTPHQALVAGTTTPATFWGLEQEVGRIEPGLRADLVLLDSNPLADIAHTRRVAGVAARGRWWSGAELRRALDEQAEGYELEAPAVERASPSDPGPMLAVLAQGPQPPESFFLSLVSVYLLARAPEAANAVLDHAFERLPASVQLHNRKAEVLEVLGRYDEARVHYESALELDPANLVARRATAG